MPTHWSSGYYFEPTVIADADQKSEIIQSEVFGPVITISAFEDARFLPCGRTTAGNYPHEQKRYDFRNRVA